MKNKNDNVLKLAILEQCFNDSKLEKLKFAKIIKELEKDSPQSILANMAKNEELIKMLKMPTNIEAMSYVNRLRTEHYLFDPNLPKILSSLMQKR